VYAVCALLGATAIGWNGVSCPRSHAALRWTGRAATEEACSSLSWASWSARLRSPCFRGHGSYSLCLRCRPACVLRLCGPPWLGARPMARPDSMARPAARLDIRSIRTRRRSPAAAGKSSSSLRCPRRPGQALSPAARGVRSQPALPVDSVYFDTATVAWPPARGAALRRVDAPRRLGSDLSRPTMRPLPLSQRGEWETQVQGPRLDRPACRARRCCRCWAIGRASGSGVSHAV